MEFAKISREGRAFPLKIQVTFYCGNYDLVFSSKEERPTALFNDFKFTQDDRNITIFYNNLASNWIYLAIYAKDFTHITLEPKFSGFFIIFFLFMKKIKKIGKIKKGQVSSGIEQKDMKKNKSKLKERFINSFSEVKSNIMIAEMS